MSVTDNSSYSPQATAALEGDAPPAMIELQGVGKIYPGSDVPAVADLDLNIPKGEILVLVGPSGCGKSTTLRLINRMIEPTSGRIIFDGEDVTTVNADQVAPSDRLRHPADRFVPAPDDRPEHRHGAEAARLGQGQDLPRGSTSCSRSRASTRTSTATGTRRSSPAVRPSAWVWPVRSAAIPTCC